MDAPRPFSFNDLSPYQLAKAATYLARRFDFEVTCAAIARRAREAGKVGQG